MGFAGAKMFPAPRASRRGATGWENPENPWRAFREAPFATALSKPVGSIIPRGHCLVSRTHDETSFVSNLVLKESECHY
jgi:hypothetical protein